MSETAAARIARIAALAAVLHTPAAFAHTGQGDIHDFLGGILHPLAGYDHALAMIAVGAVAWTLGGRARWGLPAGFLVTAVFGMVLGLAGLELPQVEMAVAASVAAMGLMLFAGRQLPPDLRWAQPSVAGGAHARQARSVRPQLAEYPAARARILEP